MRGRIVAVVLALGAVAAAGAGVYWYETVGRKAAPAAAEARAIAVSTAAVTTGTAVDRLTAVGTMYAQFQVNVTPPESGHIDALPAVEGSAVAEGDVLLVLDSDIEQATLADAQAQLKLESEKLERARTLSSRGFAAQAQLEEAQAAIAAARATVARTQVAVDHRTFKAPFAGRIGRYRYDAGAYVQPGDVITTLRSTELMYVDFHIPAAMIAKVTPGSVFTADVDGIAGSLEGVVSFIDPEIDEATRSVELRGELPNGDNILKPGMFARLTLTLAERPAALLVPEDALVYELAGRFVYRIADGKAERVAVEVGAIVAGTAEIRSGLAAGDAVITRGRFQVRHGSPVRVVDGAAKGSG